MKRFNRRTFISKFYTGVNSAHNGKHSYGPRQSVVMHATADSIWAPKGCVTIDCRSSWSLLDSNLCRLS